MAWLTGWNYRKAITISNAGSALTDYQISITVDTASLASTGKLLSNCNDIRFTSSDGSTLISYWIESGCNTSSTKIRVKAPSILSGSNTIYMYYKNSGASAASSGTGTFDFYDDFDDNDISDWTPIGTHTGPAVDVSSGKIHGGGSSGTSTVYAKGIIKSFTIPQSVVIETTLQRTGEMNDGRWGRVGVMLTFNQATMDVLPMESYWVYLDTQYDSNTANSVGILRINGAGVQTPVVSSAWTPDANEHIIKVTRNSSNLFELSMDGVSKGTATDSTYSSFPYIGFSYVVAGGQKDCYSNYIRIHKYASTEPTFSISGTEELGLTATSMTITPSETPCRTGICTVTVNVTWQNLGSSSVTFRPTIIIDGITYVQAALDTTIVGGYPATSSSIQITTPTLSAGTHTICPYPN